MKKLLVSLILLLPLLALGQKWEPVAIDSSVSAVLPKGYTVRDTLGRKIFSGTGLFGIVQVSVIPDSPKETPDIEKKKHLEKFYDGYLKKLGEAAGAVVRKEKDTLLGDLHIKTFTLESARPGDHQYRKFLLLHENCATYIFQYMYRQAEVSAEERQAFFRSVKVAGHPSAASQFTSGTVAAKDQKTNYTPVIAGGIFAVVLLVFVLLLRRRKK